MTPIAKQDIRFCKTVDGVSIAYSTMGHGYPLVIPPQLVTHLEADLVEGPLAEVYEVLSQHFTVIRFDKRGNGLSDRDSSDYSSDESFVPDIDAVVDELSLKKFAMYGFSAGGRLALHYNAKHSDRVSHLIFYGSAATATSEESRKKRDTLLAVIRASWEIGSKVWAERLMPFGRVSGGHRADRSLASALCDRRRDAKTDRNWQQAKRFNASARQRVGSDASHTPTRRPRAIRRGARVSS